jgi:hypothetical protein
MHGLPNETGRVKNSSFPRKVHMLIHPFRARGVSIFTVCLGPRLSIIWKLLPPWAVLACCSPLDCFGPSSEHSALQCGGPHDHALLKVWLCGRCWGCFGVRVCPLRSLGRPEGALCGCVGVGGRVLRRGWVKTLFWMGKNPAALTISQRMGKNPVLDG